jgi:hypothetical protein
MSTSPTASCPGRLSCAWSQHDRSHFPTHGSTQAKTQRGPAKYLPGTTPAQMRAIETATVATPGAARSQPPGKSEYLRDVGAVIGWDKGEETTLSFVECSGGDLAGRAFHGRPMAASNHKLAGRRP